MERIAGRGSSCLVCFSGRLWDTARFSRPARAGKKIYAKRYPRTESKRCYFMGCLLISWAMYPEPARIK